MFRSHGVANLLVAILASLASGCAGDSDGDASGPATATSVTTATQASGTGSTGGASDSVSSGAASDSDTSGTTGPDPTTGAVSTTTTTTTTTWPFTTGSESDSGWWETTTNGTDACKVNIDIVFVMDVSTSMAMILQTLASEILIVDQAAQMLDIETQVHYGLVVFVDDATIINAGGPYADATALQADFVNWSNFTQSNSQTSGQGYNTDWPENTLDALFTAAFGFQWRPTESTLRMIIHTTDDTFGDKGAVQSGVTVQHSYDETVQALQDRQIRVFAFADNDMTGGPSNNLDVSMGFFTPYQGKTPIPQATDGGAFNINHVYGGQLSLSAAIGESVEASLCSQYIPQ